MPVILSTWESEIRRITVQGQPEEIVCETPSPKKKKKKAQSNMHWRFGSSSRMPALQVQSPEFKPQSHQNK
jgi:hypothetical protein